MYSYNNIIYYIYVQLLWAFLPESNGSNGNIGAITGAVVGLIVGIIFSVMVFTIIVWYCHKKARPSGM